MGIFERLAPPNANDSRTLGDDFRNYMALYIFGERSRAEFVNTYQLDQDDESDLDAIDTAISGMTDGEKGLWLTKFDAAVSALEHTTWVGRITVTNFVANTSVHSLSIAGQTIEAGPAAGLGALATALMTAIDSYDWSAIGLNPPPWSAIDGNELVVTNATNLFSAVENMTVVSHERERDHYTRAEGKTFLNL